MQTLDNQMRFVEPQACDAVLVYQDQAADRARRSVLMRVDAQGEPCGFPRVGDFQTADVNLVYAFESEGQRCFLALPEGAGAPEPAVRQGCAHWELSALRPRLPHALMLAVLTGYHLRMWYRNNLRCGRCGAPVGHSRTERALVCPECSYVIYPRISPAVIVAVTDGDKLLLTRYAHGAHDKRALVAGFIEIGETAEQAAAREVLEETGVRIKNIRFYATKPWGLAGNLMIGYFAELDGSPEITLQEEELSEAMWVPRSEVEANDDYALGAEMIRHFRYNMPHD